MSKSRISKEVCSSVASSLCGNIDIKIDKITSEKRTFLDPIVSSKIPKHIQDSFAKDPGYFDTSSAVNIFTSSGHNLCKTYLGYSFPCQDYALDVVLDIEQSNYFISLEKESTSLRGKRKEAFQKMKSILYDLRTYKKISTDFPEAAKYLPEEKESTSLVNLSEIRNLIG